VLRISRQLNFFPLTLQISQMFYDRLNSGVAERAERWHLCASNSIPHNSKQRLVRQVLNFRAICDVRSTLRSSTVEAVATRASARENPLPIERTAVSDGLRGAALLSACPVKGDGLHATHQQYQHRPSKQSKRHLAISFVQFHTVKIRYSQCSVNNATVRAYIYNEESEMNKSQRRFSLR